MTGDSTKLTKLTDKYDTALRHASGTQPCLACSGDAGGKNAAGMVFGSRNEFGIVFCGFVRDSILAGRNLHGKKSCRIGKNGKMK